MTPADEVLSWTDAEIEAEISSHLSKDARFICEWLAGGWSARVERPAAGKVEVLQSVLQFDRRMALYDIYARVWLSLQAPALRPSAWDASVPRPTIASVSRYVRERVADPEDLDPGEVASVYGIGPSK